MKKLPFRLSQISIAALMVCSAGSALAANSTWNNTAFDWNTAGNWNPNVIPNSSSPNDFAVFNTASTVNPNLSISSTIGGLSFGASGTGYTLSSSGPAVTLRLTSVNSGSPAILMAAGLNTITAPLIFGGASAQQINVAGGNLTISGPITGSVGVSKVGTGTLTLSGDNSGFSGGFTHQQSSATSQLNINSATALGTGVFTTGIGATGVFIDNTSGSALTLTTNNSINFQTAGTLTFIGSSALNFGTGTMTLTGAAAIVTNSSTLTFGGPLVGSNGITKTGVGALVLGGSSAYTGATAANGGVLSITGALGNTAVTVGSSGTLNLDAANAVSRNVVTVNGRLNESVANALSGTTNVSISGAAAVANLSVANNYSGNTTLASGTLLIGNAGAIGSGTLIITGGAFDNTSGGALIISGNNSISMGGTGTFVGSNALNLGTGTMSLTAGSTFLVTSSTLTLANVISGNQALTKTGLGTLELSGSNTFTGALSLRSGTTVINTVNNNSTNGVFGNSNNSVSLGVTGTTSTLRYTGVSGTTNKTFSPNGTTVFQIDNASTVLTLSSALAGNTGITMVKTGSGTLRLIGGGSGWSGTLNVNEGKLQVGGLNPNQNPNSSTLGNLQFGNNKYNINSGGTIEFVEGGTSGNSYQTPFGTLATGVGNGNAQYVFTINSGGLLTASGGFISLLTGSNVTLNGGTITTNDGADAGNQSFYLKTAVITGGSTLSTINAGGTVNNGIHLNDNFFTVADAVSGTGVDLLVSANLLDRPSSQGGNAVGFSKAGAGTMLVTGANSFSGAVTVSAGTLQLGSATALGSTAAGTSVSTSGVLDLNGQTVGAENVTLAASGSLINSNTGTAASLAGNVTTNGALSTIGGAGNMTLTGTFGLANNSLLKIGTGTVTLSGTASGRGSATTQIDGGVLKLTGSNALNSGNPTAATVTINNGGVFELNFNGTSDHPITLNNGGTFRVSGTVQDNGKITVASSGTGTLATVNASDVFTIGNGANDISGGNSSSLLRLAGPGTSIIGNANDYVGNWSLDAGTTVLQSSIAALGATSTAKLTLNGGTLKLNYAALQTFVAGAGNNVVVTATSTIISDRTVATNNGLTYTFGNLSIGSQLNVQGGDNVTGGANPAGVTFGATTLTADSIFNVTNPTAGGTTLLTLGALNDSGTARTITKSGNGTATLGTAATSLVDGTQVNVTSGTLISNNATALGNLAAVNVSSGATFVSGTAQTLGALSGTGNVAVVGANTLTVGSSNNLSSNFAGSIGGTGAALTKAGTGQLALSGINTYTGATTVNAGTLLIASTGQLNGTSSVTVGSSGTFIYNNNTAALANSINVSGVLGGSGKLAGTISGSGLVGPGNSPGILTAAAADVTGGLDFAFEFTATGSPTYGNNTASVNDVLRLTDGSNPLVGSMDSNNIIKIYLNVGSLNSGDIFYGGFYTDKSASFLAAISGASYEYYLFNAGGAYSYNGTNYDLYTGPLSFEVNSVAQTANFGGGDVTGYVTEFSVIPEPSTLMLAGLGLAAVLARRRRRA